MKRIIITLALAFVSVLIACSSEHSYQRGIRAFEDGQWKKSIRHFELVSGWDDRYADAQRRIYKAYFNWGKAKMGKQNWDLAIAYLGKVRREDADYKKARGLIGDINYYRGKDAFDRGEWQEAIWYLNIVRSSNSHYEDSRDLVQAAKAELRQSKQDTLIKPATTPRRPVI